MHLNCFGKAVHGLFAVGHVRILKKAKQLGDYLIVGIHGEDPAAWGCGLCFPSAAVGRSKTSALFLECGRRRRDGFERKGPRVSSDGFARTRLECLG